MRRVRQHFDNNQGFLPGCQLLFKSISTDGRDYHTEMNGVIFEDWLKNKLLPALPEPSLIIMDNAPYHKRQDGGTKAPTMANKHSEIQKWLILCKSSVHATSHTDQLTNLIFGTESLYDTITWGFQRFLKIYISAPFRGPFIFKKGPKSQKT